MSICDRKMSVHMKRKTIEDLRRADRSKGGDGEEVKEKMNKKKNKWIPQERLSRLERERFKKNAHNAVISSV